MSFFKRLFGTADDQARTPAAYVAVVAAARTPDWYLAGAVPDTIDGRFEMVAAMLSLALLRLERDGDLHAAESVALTETFVRDMDGQLREIGIGDVVVGKHIGKMMSALGGRLGAYRSALAEADDKALVAALGRNLYRGAVPEGDGLAYVARRIRALDAALAAQPADALLAGGWPAA